MTSPKAAALAARCADAYSAQAYANWGAVAAKLLQRGYSELEAEAIMRSKWTRWAADSIGKWSDVPASALLRWMDDPRQGCTKDAVRELVHQTFPHLRVVAPHKTPTSRPSVGDLLGACARGFDGSVTKDGIQGHGEDTWVVMFTHHQNDKAEKRVGIVKLVDGQLRCVTNIIA